MPLLCEKRGAVAILMLSRPEARNAWCEEFQTGLPQHLTELEDDRDIRCVILTGDDRGGAFSAGADLKNPRTHTMDSVADFIEALPNRRRTHPIPMLTDFAKPIIAAVNGSALAGGFEIMLSCDLVVAAEHATFGIPEAKRGLIAGAGGLIRMPKRLPIAIALELAMTGDTIDAARAFELGLVNRVVPSSVVIEEAVSLADRIAANAPLAVRYSKSVMKQAAELSEAEGWKINAEAVGVVFTSADAMEGPVAFAEKRPPNWQGK